MKAAVLREMRQQKGWTQQRTAEALGVTQAYLSMLEQGKRPLPSKLAHRALAALHLSPTVLPLPAETDDLVRSSLNREYSTELGGLGYPGFAYFNAKPRHNPAEVLFDALNEPDLDARVAEGLPWLLLKYSDMDWNWLVRNVKLHDRQNRLGFVVNLAKDIAKRTGKTEVENCLVGLMDQLEQSRLAKEDTFCHESMTEAERKWLRVHRPAVASHWNLLTDLSGEQLEYSSQG